MHPDANIVGRCRRLSRRRGAIIGILLLAIVVVEVPKYLLFLLLHTHRESVLPGVLLWQALVVGTPFFLARIAPTLADFDRQWLPSAWSQWLWFPGMVLLLLIGGGSLGWLLSFHKDGCLSFSLRVAKDVAPVTVVFHGVVLILLAPIAEELFWRAFFLSQLQKLTRWPIAISIHSLLFSLAHIPAGWPVLVASFFYGMILGIWRIRFRSLLPLVLAHMILNGAAHVPTLKAQYDAAVQSYPQCREIDLLTREPVAKAVPALIAYMADRDETVSGHALEVLGRNYRSEAEPYLAEALASNDEYTVDRVLAAIDFYGYSGLQPQVRAIAWTSENLRIRESAVLALSGIGDQQGLSDIAQRHPEEKVRQAARDLLRLFHEERRGNGSAPDADGR